MILGPLLPVSTQADEIHVAVASNFVKTMQELAVEFEKNTGHSLLLSSGSSGKHYAQIKNGAPYDVFFSADKDRPKRLEQELLAVNGSRFTYAVGRLALWGKNSSLLDQKEHAFIESEVSRIAIANPRLAPYGKAAQQVLVSLGLWGDINKKIVRGENVNQAYQFVASENAQIGIMSYAQMHRSKHDFFWLIPANFHEPIEQQAVILKDSEAAQALFLFMRSDNVLKLITQQGYDRP